MQRAVELVFPDGDSQGTMTASVPLWDGKLVRISRSQVSHPNSLLMGNGLYLLVQPGLPDSVYFGETEILQRRLEQHMADYKSGKEQYFWTYAWVLLCPGFGKTEMLYLENRMAEAARASGACRVLTQETHLSTPITDGKRIAADSYFEQAQFLLEVFGAMYISPPSPAVQSSEIPIDATVISPYHGDPDKSLIIYDDGERSVTINHYLADMTNRQYSLSYKGYSGTGEFRCKGIAQFHVLPGAVVHEVKGRLRRKCLVTEKGLVVKQPIAFDTPTEAAAFITGEAIDGYDHWVDTEGISLGKRKMEQEVVYS